MSRVSASPGPCTSGPASLAGEAHRRRRGANRRRTRSRQGDEHERRLLPRLWGWTLCEASTSGGAGRLSARAATRAGGVGRRRDSGSNLRDWSRTPSRCSRPLKTRCGMAAVRVCGGGHDRVLRVAAVVGTARSAPGGRSAPRRVRRRECASGSEPDGRAASGARRGDLRHRRAATVGGVSGALRRRRHRDAVRSPPGRRPAGTSAATRPKRGPVAARAPARRARRR
jgi:hypothetical protein